MSSSVQDPRLKEREAAAAGAADASSAAAATSSGPSLPCGDPTTFRFVSVRNGDDDVDERRRRTVERELLLQILTYLSWASVGSSLVLLLCQVGAAVCLCRPVAVLGGVLVSFLLLCQGVFGKYAVKIFSQSLLVGYATMSVFVSVSVLGSALYLLSGHYTILCISSFHSNDQQSALRLHIVECLSLASCAPCLIGAVACLVCAALSAKGSKQLMEVRRREPQVFLYLQPPGHEEPFSGPPGRDTAPSKGGPLDASAPALAGHTRTTTPPPSYTQVNDESYA